jgi:hypothetical protein
MPSCVGVFWCIFVFLLVLFIYYSFRIWTSEELKKCKEKQNNKNAGFWDIFLRYPRIGLIKEGYLFSWDNVPGNDNEILVRFLRDELAIGWAKNAGIHKSDDGKTIRIFNGENSAEIMIDEKEEKATLKISDGRTHDLKVKKENGKLNIYKERKKWNKILDECKEKHNIIKAYYEGIIYYSQIRFRGEGFSRIIALIILLCLSFGFGCIWIDGYSFNNQQLYYYVFSTLAQVFGALIGLLVIIITTVILRSERNSASLKCTENIKNDIRFSLFPSAIILIYSIVILSISPFLIETEFCRVIITICGMEIPILAIDALIPLIHIIEECRKEIKDSHFSNIIKYH